MKKYALIVAGGIGARMNQSVPKQFMLLAGKPVLMYSIEAFFQFSNDIHLIVVLPETLISQWKQLCAKYNFKFVHQVVAGGKTRFHSVKNGLNVIPDEDGIVAIHDAARPLITASLIKKLFEDTEKYGNAIPALPMKDSMRIISEKGNNPIDRSKLRIIQTPQCFNIKIIKQAFIQQYRDEFTDDATVIESEGHSIHLTDGDENNIKITTLADLNYLESILLLKNL